VSWWYKYISRNTSRCPGGMNIYPGISRCPGGINIYPGISRCPGGKNIYPGIYLGVLVV